MTTLEQLFASMRPDRLFLVGMPGSGKTHWGQTLAKSLGYGFCDTDHEVEKRAGKSVAQIFEEEGEAAFRALELEVLEDLLHEHHNIIATGGGLPMHDGVMDRLKADGLVVWLYPPDEAVLERLELEGAAYRPLLSGGNGLRENWKALLTKRQDTYGKAHVWVREIFTTEKA